MAGSVLVPIRFLRQTESYGLDPLRCWIWKGQLNSNGYGRFVVGNNHKLAHRISYELFVGPIVDDLNVCHSCDNRKCVNPHHLWLGTQSDNLKDAAAKGRMRAPDTRGHKNGNTRLTPDDVARIRAMFAGGMLKFRIAKAFGISPSSVADIISRKTWKDAA